MENWYYVHKGNRQGPVAVEVIQDLIKKDELKSEDYIWKKGFDNWKKIKDVPEILVSKPAITQKANPEPIPATPVETKKSFKLAQLEKETKNIFIRVGLDRGQTPNEYGPFTVSQLKALYKENRINGKTQIFSTGMSDWILLADVEDYQTFFHELPPVIQDIERRNAKRKPFVARMFVHNNKKLYEGVCRDISVGGMQVLLDNFLGKAGDKITINVHPENSDYHFTASGEVVRVLEGQSGFSFRFNQLSDEAHKAIEKYLKDN